MVLFGLVGLCIFLLLNFFFIDGVGLGNTFFYLSSFRFYLGYFGGVSD